MNLHHSALHAPRGHAAPFLRTALLGATAGLRVTAPGAALALASHRLRGVALPAALAENVNDKLPNTPSRLAPPLLIPRLGAGALAGALYLRAAGRSPALGSAIGAASALLGSFAGYHLRRAAGRATGVPDPWFGLVEDGLTASLAALALRGTHRRRAWFARH